MASWKESMINRLSNLINRNHSVTKISQVLCSSKYTNLKDAGGQSASGKLDFNVIVQYFYPLNPGVLCANRPICKWLPSPLLSWSFSSWDSLRLCDNSPKIFPAAITSRALKQLLSVVLTTTANILHVKSKQSTFFPPMQPPPQGQPQLLVVAPAFFHFLGAFHLLEISMQKVPLFFLRYYKQELITSTWPPGLQPQIGGKKSPWRAPTTVRQSNCFPRYHLGLASDPCPGCVVHFDQPGTA